MISLIVAHDQNRVIGNNNEMPWHIPEELSYFKKMTMGKALIMGRKTYDSIGRPLPGRKTIVISRNEDYAVDGVTVVHSLKDAIAVAEDYAEEVMVIGGAEIFRIALSMADRLYITFIQNSYKGDIYFPTYGPEWKLISTSDEIVSKEGTSFTYLIYEKK